MADSLSLAHARRIALRAQGFGRQRSDAQSGWPRIRKAIERMGLLQLDSINVLARSHYLPIYSRIGAYDMARLDAKSFSRQRHRELFEYWGHEASLLPFSLHPLLRWRMARAERLEGLYRQVAEFVRERPDFVARVAEQISARGRLSARELDERGRGGGSWAWDEGKAALEYLFWSGQVTIAERRGFERVYDLTERVLPPEVVALPTPAEADAQRELVAIAAGALGIATESDLRDYFRLPASDAKRCVAELVEAKRLVPVQVEGWRAIAYMDGCARAPRPIRGQALLSPFDPLVWERARTERLFGFHYRIEIYTPAAKRRYGYYVLPFLLDEQLVARIDLKADRAERTLRAVAAHYEDGADPGRVARALSCELDQLSAWLGLERVAIGRRGNLASELRRATRRQS